MDGTTAEPSESSSPWRAASSADLDAIMEIQAEVHPLLQERQAVMADKLALFPEGCRMLEEAGRPVAYALAHPYLIGQVPLLDGTMERLPPRPDCIYIHDVALLAPARGRGAGRAFASEMGRLAAAKSLSALTLVSVYGTYPMWEKCGFRTQPLEGLAEKFGPFGSTARYMVARLPNPSS